MEARQELRLDLLALGRDGLALDRDELGVDETPQRLLEHPELFWKLEFHHASPCFVRQTRRVGKGAGTPRFTRARPSCAVPTVLLYRFAWWARCCAMRVARTCAWSAPLPTLRAEVHHASPVRQITRTSTATAPLERTINGLISMSSMR